MMKLASLVLPKKQAKALKLAKELYNLQKMQKLSEQQASELKTIGAFLDRVELVHDAVGRRKKRCIHKKFGGVLSAVRALVGDVPLPDAAAKSDALVLATLHKVIAKLAKQKNK